MVREIIPECRATSVGIRKHTLQVVEIRFAAENFGGLMARVRPWLEDESFRPRTLRYRLSEPESVLRVDFEVEGQAQAFARAFDGVVLAQASLDRGAQRSVCSVRTTLLAEMRLIT